VKLHTQAAVDRFWYDGKNTSLRMKSGDFISAGNYLLAAGAWSEELIGTLFCFPDIHPVRGQIALLRGESCSRVLMFGKRYLVPRGDGLTLVGSTEEPEAGFEKQTTAEAIGGLLAFARRVVPPLASAKLETSWAGLRPGTPDGLPYLGPVPGWDGVFVAAGHFRAGVQLSIGTAQVIGELVTGKPTSVPLEAFSLLREPDVKAKPVFRS
jgi:glycine oxidase